MSGTAGGYWWTGNPTLLVMPASWTCFTRHQPLCLTYLKGIQVICSYSSLQTHTAVCSSAHVAVYPGSSGVVARLLSETPGVRVATARLPNSSQSDVLILRPDSVVYSPQEAVARAGLAHDVSTTDGETSGTAEEAALRSPVWLLVGANFMPSHLTCQDYYARSVTVDVAQTGLNYMGASSEDVV